MHWGVWPIFRLQRVIFQMFVAISIILTCVFHRDIDVFECSQGAKTPSNTLSLCPPRCHKNRKIIQTLVFQLAVRWLVSFSLIYSNLYLFVFMWMLLMWVKITICKTSINIFVNTTIVWSRFLWQIISVFHSNTVFLYQ